MEKKKDWSEWRLMEGEQVQRLFEKNKWLLPKSKLITGNKNTGSNKWSGDTTEQQGELTKGKKQDYIRESEKLTIDLRSIGLYRWSRPVIAQKNWWPKLCK
jgi:hypothetical protein